MVENDLLATGELNKDVGTLLLAGGADDDTVPPEGLAKLNEIGVEDVELVAGVEDVEVPTGVAEKLNPLPVPVGAAEKTDVGAAVGVVFGVLPKLDVPPTDVPKSPCFVDEGSLVPVLEVPKTDPLPAGTPNILCLGADESLDGLLPKRDAPLACVPNILGFVEVGSLDGVPNILGLVEKDSLVEVLVGLAPKLKPVENVKAQK